MRVAFISTRGIPNNYGGFEQFAEYVSIGLVQCGYEVVIYSPHFHSYKESTYKGVKIKHIYSPEKWLRSSIGSFFYDFLSLRDALKRGKFDIIYVAGYTSIVPAYIWFNIKSIKYPIVITNMDGLEYKRTKFNKWIQKFLFWEEQMTIKHSHYLIADNMGIHDYYKEKYGKESKYLAYGANIYNNYNEAYLNRYNLIPNSYYLLIARLEPENNIERIIQGYLNCKDRNKQLIIVGNTNISHGKYLIKRYGGNDNIRFLGGIYDFEKINSIRYFSYAYFHGHSVGGTNPSLLEAMASKCFIIAHDNIFNKSILKENALYFRNTNDISEMLNNINNYGWNYKEKFVANNLECIKKEYSWEKLINEYEKYFNWLLEQNKEKERAYSDS
ncbi:hypothetical protein EZS27_010180 [termite gut metagenome]|uniref:Glycosyltransferase subfamily 4-like N-terminal domain-containing protein n=1 Tax=termite gut metagenome TaxID=433724 RepID=A0A5J4S7G3_9ZZZZ